MDNDFDKCKADFESRITALIDNLFTIDFNTNEVWAYSAPSSAGASNIFNGFVLGVSLLAIVQLSALFCAATSKGSSRL